MDLVLSNFAERGVCGKGGGGGKAKLVVLRPFEKDKQHNWMEAGRSGREKNNTNHIPDRSDSGYRAVQTTAALWFPGEAI